MKRILTAVITAIEAGAVALTGLVSVAVPGILLWIVTLQLANQPAEVAAAVSGVWLLGHGVPLNFIVDAPTALALGLAPEALTFTLSLAPLGLAMISAGFGARIGWRLGRRGGAGVVGLPAGALGFAALSLLPVSLAAPLLGTPPWVAVLLPTLFFGVPAAAGFVLRAAHDDHEWWHRILRDFSRRATQLGWLRPQDGRAVISDALRLSAATLAVLMGIAALGVAVALIGGYAQVVTLSQHLQLDPVGAIIIFLVQLAMLPVAVIWALSWLVGSGFAIGAGTSVTSFETLLGPVPALPMFGAIPPAWGSWGGVAMLLIVLGALACGVMFARRRSARGIVREAVVLVLAAALVGLAIAGFAALSTGSIGPQRLEVTGPDAWITGGLAAAEVLLGLVLGTFGARADVSRNLEQARSLVVVGGQRVRGAANGLGRGSSSTPGGTDHPTEDYEQFDLSSATESGTTSVNAATLDYSDMELEPLRPTPRDPQPEMPEGTVTGQDPVGPISAGGTTAETQLVEGNSGPSGADIEPAENDPVAAEEALVRAYAWDESTHIDDGSGDKERAPVKRSWWRRPTS